MKAKLTLMLIVSLVLWAFNASAENGLMLNAVKVDATQFNLLKSPHAAGWDGFTSFPIHLNRTPPLYTGDALDDGFRPGASVKIAREGEKILVRIHWQDNTENVASFGKRYPDAGEDHVYPKQTESTSAFPDALCIMVPKKRGEHTSYPTVIMGEPKKPVDLYFWKAGEGFSRLSAHGRASVEAEANSTLEGTAVRDGDGWSVVMEVENMMPGTPTCFAVWDGAKEQRDGLKYYSLWYEIE